MSQNKNKKEVLKTQNGKLAIGFKLTLGILVEEFIKTYFQLTFELKTNVQEVLKQPSVAAILVFKLNVRTIQELNVE